MTRKDKGEGDAVVSVMRIEKRERGYEGEAGMNKVLKQ